MHQIKYKFQAGTRRKKIRRGRINMSFTCYVRQWTTPNEMLGDYLSTTGDRGGEHYIPHDSSYMVGNSSRGGLSPRLGAITIKKEKSTYKDIRNTIDYVQPEDPMEPARRSALSQEIQFNLRLSLAQPLQTKMPLLPHSILQTNQTNSIPSSTPTQYTFLIYYLI